MKLVKDFNEYQILDMAEGMKLEFSKSVTSDFVWVCTAGALPANADVCSATVPTAPSRIV